MNGQAKRNRERRLTREICGKKHICPESAAKLLGCSRSKLDTMVAKSKNGSLKPPLKWYRDTPRSPMWFSTEFLVDWVRMRSEVHGD